MLSEENMLMVLDQLPDFLAEYPNASLADIMAEFDLTETEAREVLAEYRRQIKLGVMGPMSDERLARMRQQIAEAVAASARMAGMAYDLEEGFSLEDQVVMIDEIMGLRRRERPLLVLLRAVATGEPLPVNFVHQARGWLQAEDAAARPAAPGRE